MTFNFNQGRLGPPTLAYFTLAIAIAFACGACGSSSQTSAAENQAVRIVSAAAPVTEIIYALGADKMLVGVDTSSVYPDAVNALPRVGYQRTLSAEGVLSLKPTHLFVLPEAGPPAVIAQIESAGVKVIRVNNEPSVEGARQKVREVAAALGLESRSDDVQRQMDADLAESQRIVREQKGSPKTVFLYSRGAGAVNVGGTGTPADEMIRLAGASNAITGFSDYKPLTAEAIVAAQPDVILLPARSLEPIGGIDGVLRLPGVADTPAGRNRRIVAVDDTQLLGFTPRVGKGLRELCEKLHQ